MLNKIYVLRDSLSAHVLSVWIPLMLIVLMVATSPVALASPLRQTQATATVLTAALNLRSGPGVNFSRIGSVKRGDVLTVIGQTGKCAWLQVQTAQNGAGWVAGGTSLVKLAVACSAIPATAAPAATPATVAPPADVAAPAQLGVDFGSFITLDEVVSADFPLAKAMGAQWTRIELPWLKIEPSQGAFDWQVYDAAMQRAKQLGVRVLAVIHSPPTWAATESCGPITDTSALTSFVKAAVNRYRSTVYAWEFINEPDGKAPLPNYGPTIGCWGPAPAPYAQQLALFYKTVKALAPNTLVLFGSLAYDNWALFERQFLSNALANGAGAYFDVLGVHFYPINPVEFPSIRNKIDEIRGILNKYGLNNKQIWVTETSMWTNAGATGESQKDFIVREQTRALCNGADKLFWFAVRQERADPPLHRWLINLQHEPDQGYFTYQHYASQIQGRSCQGGVPNLPSEIEAYRWSGTGKTELYILWSNSTHATPVTLPVASTATLINRSGTEKQAVTPQNGVITVEIGPQPSFVVVDK